MKTNTTNYNRSDSSGRPAPFYNKLKDHLLLQWVSLFCVLLSAMGNIRAEVGTQSGDLPFKGGGNFERWSLGPTGIYFLEKSWSGPRALRVARVAPGSPADQAGVRLEDRVVGVEGKTFTKSAGNNWDGIYREFAQAIERAERGDGKLPVTLVRSGVGRVDVILQLGKAGAFGPAYAYGSPKFQAMYEEAVNVCYKSIRNNNKLFYSTAYQALILLGDPHWNDTTGAKPYRLALDHYAGVVAQKMNAEVFEPLEKKLPDGSPNPNFNASENVGTRAWHLMPTLMFLAEYRKKTGDTSLDAVVQRSADLLANRVIDWKGQDQFGQKYADRGVMTDVGVTGSYGAKGFNAINAMALMTFGMLNEAGATVNDDKFQKCWHEMAKAMTAAGQIAYRSGGDKTRVAFRNTGALVGGSLYGADTLSTTDREAFDRAWNFTVNDWGRVHETYNMSAGTFLAQQLLMTFMSPQERAYHSEYQQTMFQFHRHGEGEGGITYLGNNINSNNGDRNIGFHTAGIINIGMAHAVGSGGFSCFPKPSTDQIYADFKVPGMGIPRKLGDSRLYDAKSLTVQFAPDITDYKGASLPASAYTAQWVASSGPGTPVFSSPASAQTTITFPQDGEYDISLQVTTGSFTLTEPIHVVVDTVTVPGYVKGIVNIRYYERVSNINNVDPEKPTVTLSMRAGRLSGVNLIPYHGKRVSGSSRVSGILIPPTTGDYTFRLDRSRLTNGWMKINPTGVDPDSSGLFQVCNKLRKDGATVHLQAGVPIYYEVLIGNKPPVLIQWKTPGSSEMVKIGEQFFAVKDEVKIINQIAEVSASAGSVALLPLCVEGPGPFVSEWYKDGQPIDFSKGATSELEIGNVSSGNAGRYHCVVSYDGGVIGSNPLVLSMQTSFQSGALWMSSYANISDKVVTIDDLRADISFPGAPTKGSRIQSFKYEVGAKNLGIRVSGWIVPDETADYIFKDSSAGASELWLSTDDSPLHKINIATRDSESDAISMEAGKRYYVELLYVKKAWKASFSIKWRKSTEPSTEAVIIPEQNLKYLKGGSFETSPVRETARGPMIASISVADVSSTEWKLVNLEAGFTSPVVVATPISRNQTSVPVVTRLRNVGATSFEIKLDRADGQSGNITASVSVTVVEEGVYTLAENGVQMEAVKYDSIVTDNKTSWSGESKSYQNTYVKPIVLGQVMTANDPKWSVFWSCGNTTSNPPSATVLKVGKHVAEDPDTTRSNETVGYIVIEAGNGLIQGIHDVAYTANRGSDTVMGISANGYSYEITGVQRVGSVALSSAAMDGADGGWPVLFGQSPLLSNKLTLIINEDLMRDSERAHTTEEVSYLVFSGFPQGDGAPSPGNDLYAMNRDTATTVNMNDVTGNDADPEGGVLAVQSWGTPTQGLLTGAGSVLEYTPNAGFVGKDSFPYTVVDEFGNTSVGRVVFNVLPVQAVVETMDVQNIQLTTAKLGYILSDNGGADTSIKIYCGKVNAGRNYKAWEKKKDLGTKPNGNGQTTFSNLTPSTTYYYGVYATNSSGESWGEVKSFRTLSNPLNLVKTKVSDVSSASWTQVDLGYAYINPVLIATPYITDSSAPPVSVRVRNAAGSSVELRLNRLDGASDPVTMDVSLVAVEQGTYTVANNGVKMEAVKFTSTVTAKKGSWIAEARTYQNTYTNPIVIGQVMSANDAAWSEFWCKGATQTSPPSANEFSVGKQVGEDPNTTRVDETIGYIVIEAGSGQISGIDYIAGLGNDTVLSTGDTSTGYTYSITGLSTVSAAALSQAGMDGADGSWAALYGATPLTPTTLTIAVDEDKLGDSERKHTTEQVSYILFK